MHPKGSPKYNLQKAALGVKNIAPNIRKRSSPKGVPRAQWNLALEKSLVEILHEHNNEYYRAQNGWNGDTWNQMAKIFQNRNKHVNFTKSQLQFKEKELKRDYKMLKEARMQSGAGWCEESCKIQADKELWDNLIISYPKIGKFRRNEFPLFDSLGDLYDGQIAEGKYNFTSTSNPSQIGGEYEDERVAEDGQSVNENDDDLQILDGVGPAQRGDGVNSVNQVDVGSNEKKVAGVRKKKPPKELKKPTKSDELVGVVDRYVKMKEKQVEDEKAESNVFSIAKCISALHKMKEFTREERVRASKVFKIAENREMFLTWAAEDEESAIMWLRGELKDLP